MSPYQGKPEYASDINLVRKSLVNKFLDDNEIESWKSRR
jgi:hypothetical protein